MSLLSDTALGERWAAVPKNLGSMLRERLLGSYNCCQQLARRFVVVAAIVFYFSVPVLVLLAAETAEYLINR